MGFNTTFVICNDAMGAIDDDPAGWWSEAKHAAFRALSQRPVEFGFGCHANGFWVAATHHADVVSLIAVGGNYPSVVSRESWGNRGHREPADQVELLRRAADKLGYVLVRKIDNGRASRGE